MDTDLMKGKCHKVASIMKAIAHPQRLLLLCYLTEGEKNVSELLQTCELSQSQLSQFLNRMQREGILKVRKEGTFAYYSIADRNVLKLMQSMHKIFCS